MTELFYQADSYIKSFQAKVVGVLPDENVFILDKTAFYPGGGGQPKDQGELVFDGNTLKLIDIKLKNGQAWHTAEDYLPQKGQDVEGRIDWDHRYKVMRTHTALHILCGVVWRDYGALVTGGNMEPLKGRMDFEFETLNNALAREIENKVNSEVESQREIITQILSREEAFKIPDLIRTKINLLPESITHVRTVEIKGLDLQADGGTHVKNTGEVGKIRFADYKSKGKINKRIYIELEE